MTIQRRELYRSSNGDRWLLARDIEIGAFLSQGRHGPEHQELLRLIGMLVEE
jgi:hypothetical protein